MRAFRTIAFAIICVLASLLSSGAGAEPRIALVVGNAHYGAEMGDVAKAVDDAKLIAETLKRAGFQVLLVSDVDQMQMKRAIADFGKVLAKAGPTATGLFFFTGHGVQIHGRNFLIPIHAEIAREADVDIEAIDLGLVLEQMEFAGAATNIFVIDASRNNPLQRELRTLSRGLADISGSSPGVFISYATAPGTVVIDGAGPHSAYVTALADSLLTPGQNIHDLFDHVRAAVLAATDDRQLTWDASTLTKPFYFVPNGN